MEFGTFSEKKNNEKNQYFYFEIRRIIQITYWWALTIVSTIYHSLNSMYVCFFLLFLSFHLIRIWSQISNHSFQIIQNDLLFKLIFSFNCRLFDCSFVAFLERHNSPIKFQKWWITNEEYWQNQAISILLLYRNGYGILDYKFHLI